MLNPNYEERGLLKAAGYVRVSSKNSKTASIEVQKQDIEDQIRIHKNIFTKHYVDAGVSGGAKKRPAFDRCMEDAKAGKFKVLYVYAFDRLARNLRIFLRTFDNLMDLDCGLVSTAQGVSALKDDEYGSFAIKVLGLVSELQRNQIRRTTLEGRIKNVAAGNYIPGFKMAYGYYHDKETKEVKIDPVKGPIYRRIVRLYTVQKLSTADIADKLTGEGIPRPNGEIGKPWQPGGIYDLLVNPCYRQGYQEFFKYNYELQNAKESGEPYFRRLDRKKDKEKIAKEGTKRKTVKVPYPILMEPHEWALVQKFMAKKKFRKGTRTIKNFPDEFVLLQAMQYRFRCGICQFDHDPPRKSKIARHYYKRANELLRYSCTKQSQSRRQLAAHGQDKCTMPRVDARMIDKMAWDYATKIIASPRHFIKSGVIRGAFGKKDESVPNYESKLKHKRASLKRLSKMIERTEDELILDDLYRSYDNLNKEIEGLKDKIELKKASTGEPEDGVKYLERFLKALEIYVQDVEDGMDPEDQYIPEVKEALDAITDIERKKEVLQTVFQPEDDGIVYLYHDDELGHYLKYDYNLDIVRVCDLIKELLGKDDSIYHLIGGRRAGRDRGPKNR